MEQGCFDFSEWERNAIRTDFGLVFAPEDFHFSDRTGRRRDYFSGGQARMLEECLFIPAGWRLPTLDDWIAAATTFRSSERMRSELGLKTNGFIHPDDWEKFKKQPTAITPLHQGVRGYYWSSTKHGDCSSWFLRITNPKGIMTTKYCYWEEGLSVRCVHSKK